MAAKAKSKAATDATARKNVNALKKRVDALDRLATAQTGCLHSIADFLSVMAGTMTETQRVECDRLCGEIDGLTEH